MMKASQIKAELREREIDFADCFDKESLAEKLVQARAGLISPKPPPGAAPPPSAASVSSGDMELEIMRAEIWLMRVSQIKAELIELGVDFSDCFDKEGLTDKLFEARVGRSSSANSAEPAAPQRGPPVPRPRGAANGNYEFGAETRVGEEDMSLDEAFKAAGWTGASSGTPREVDQMRSPGLNRNFGDLDQADFKKPYTRGS